MALPVVSGVDVIKALAKIHCKPRRQRGSHVILRKDTGPPFNVPIHPGKPLKKGTIAHILKQAGVSVERFLQLLKDC